MKLFGTPTSPYVRKVRIVLNEKKIPYEFILEELGSPKSTLSQFNPLGKVPCIVLDDNQILYDSSVIVDYVDALKSDNPLLPENARERAFVKCWEALADGVMDASILVRLEDRREKAMQSADWVNLQMGKVATSLKALSDQLGSNTYCYNNQFSLADIAVGCALGWLNLRFGEVTWKKDYPNLAKLYERLLQRGSFKETEPPI